MRFRPLSLSAAHKQYLLLGFGKCANSVKRSTLLVHYSSISLFRYLKTGVIVGLEGGTAVGCGTGVFGTMQHAVGGGADVGGTDVGGTDVGGTAVGITTVGGIAVGGTAVGGTDVGNTGVIVGCVGGTLVGVETGVLGVWQFPHGVIVGGTHVPVGGRGVAVGNTGVIVTIERVGVGTGVVGGVQIEHGVTVGGTHVPVGVGGGGTVGGGCTVGVPGPGVIVAVGVGVGVTTGNGKIIFGLPQPNPPSALLGSRPKTTLPLFKSDSLSGQRSGLPLVSFKTFPSTSTW